MLDFRYDRIDYGQMLIPPEGYRLERAIAVTYSLDLNTLLSIPIALFYSQTLEGQLTGERFQVLEAIQQTAECVTVYCQEGHIHVPSRYNRLFAFMEEMIVQVRPSNAFTSFHPKVWIIRYVEDGLQAIYRVLVLTRNLTYDRSWDLAVCLEGKAGKTRREVNQPLIDFLDHLNAIRNIDGFPQFRNDLRKAKFVPPPTFDRIAFHPMGIAGHRSSPVRNITANEGLCMSPFMDNESLSNLRKQIAGEFSIFGRKHEMTNLSAEVLRNCHAYCISDLVVEGEYMADCDDADAEPLEQDLHAKLFVFQQPERTRWYVGSANATKAAEERNVEFLLELIGNDRRVTLNQALEDILGNEKYSGVFEEFSPEDAKQNDSDAERRILLRKLEYDLIHANLRGSLVLSQNQTNYDLRIRLDLRKLAAPKEITLSIKPLNCIDMMVAEFEKDNICIFENIKETEITRFIAISIMDEGETFRSFLVRYELDGIPKSRLDSIFKSIISNREKFLEYLGFLLTEDVSKGDFVSDPPKKGVGLKGEESIWNTELPIFERLISAASRDPIRLKAVDNLVERLKAKGPAEEQLLPPGFLDFWEVFRPLIPPSETENGHNAK